VKNDVPLFHADVAGRHADNPLMTDVTELSSFFDCKQPSAGNILRHGEDENVTVDARAWQM
jgi:hypothetical protein